MAANFIKRMRYLEPKKMSKDEKFKKLKLFEEFKNWKTIWKLGFGGLF